MFARLLQPLVSAFGAGRAFAELDYGIAVHERRIAGHRVAVHEAGDGDPPLVLVHGLGSDMRVWMHNLPWLAQRHRVVAFDLLGFGRSDKPADAGALADHVACVRALVQSVGGRAVIVGHSMGGQIAMHTALAHPEIVLGLVLSAPAGLERFDREDARKIRAVVVDEYTRFASPLQVAMRHAQLFHRVPPGAWPLLRDRLAVIGGPDFPAYCRAVTRSVAAMLEEPVVDALHRIAAPTLVTFGRHDGLIPNRFLHRLQLEPMAREAVARLGRGRLEMLADAGHMPQLEQPERWNALVSGFLATALQHAAEP
jgi:pimeloyl-ACP methyl ester carboxylesterase